MKAKLTDFLEKYTLAKLTWAGSGAIGWVCEKCGVMIHREYRQVHQDHHADTSFLFAMIQILLVEGAEAMKLLADLDGDGR